MSLLNLKARSFYQPIDKGWLKVLVDDNIQAENKFTLVNN